MKKSYIFIFTCILISILLCINGTYTKADFNAKNEAKSVIEDIVSFNAEEAGVQDAQALLSDVFPEKIGGTAEWYVLGLSQYGGYDLEKYRSALENYLYEKDVKGASARLKFSLLLSFSDGNREYIDRCMSDGTVGGQGIMSYVFGLHLINNGYTGNISLDEILENIVKLCHEDGGWSVTGNYGDVDVTAMTLTALAPLYTGSGQAKISTSTEYNENPVVNDGILELLVENAINFLSNSQLDDGGFSSFGVENAESNAQVITALSALGIDCATNERFIKNGNTVFDGLMKYRLSDGSFSHKKDDASNPSATMQTFYAMVAYLRMSEGMTPLYVRDVNETKLTVTYGDTGVLSDSKSASNDGNYNLDNNEKNTDNSLDNKSDDIIDNNTNNDINNKSNKDLDNQNVDGNNINNNNKDSKNGTDLDSGYADNSSDKNAGKNSGYKTYAIIILLGVCLAVSILLFLLKKHWKNHLFVGLVGLAGVLIIIFTDFTSPENYYGQETVKSNAVGTVTMSITCDILKDKEKNEHIPEDYVVLKTTGFDLEKGETVYDILLEAAKKYNISVEHEGSSDIVYISGINFLYENDYGDLSGWVYKVNGVLPSVGCGGYELKDGDIIEWCYTLDLGNDSLK